MKYKRKRILFFVGQALFILGIVSFFFFARNVTTRENRAIVINPDNCYDQTIIMVADRDYDPYSFFDSQGKPSGYDIELMYAIANQMEVNIEIRLMNWTECKQAVLSGKADIISGLDYEKPTSENFILSMALHNDQYVCFGKENFSSIGELYSKKLATVEDSGSFSVFLEPYRLTENTRVYSTYTQVLESVISGENDYAISRYYVGRRILAKLKETKVRPVNTFIANNSTCFGLGEHRAELLPELDNAILSMREDGTLAALENKWLGSYVTMLTPQDFLRTYQNGILFGIAGFLILISGIVFYINREKIHAARMEQEDTARILEYQQLITEATKGLYESIYEFDVTHNRAVGEHTEHYFESFGIPGTTPFDQALQVIAKKQIRKEFIQGYLDTFMPENVLRAFRKGETSLGYDFMITQDGINYYWIHISARLFFWNADKSVRMILYRRNIDAEKKQEQRLLDAAQRDSMTGLYNKTAAESLAESLLEDCRHSGQARALVIIDIDDFKRINDTFGHAYGDSVIRIFAETIIANIRKTDIAGRIGGDEFLILFTDIPGRDWLEFKLRKLNQELSREVTADNQTRQFSASIGAVLIPQVGETYAEIFKKADLALYRTKEAGKNGHTIYAEGM